MPRYTQWFSEYKQVYIMLLLCDNGYFGGSSHFDYQFGEEEDSYTFAINKPVSWGCPPGRAKYKVVIVPEQECSAVYF